MLKHTLRAFVEARGPFIDVSETSANVYEFFVEVCGASANVYDGFVEVYKGFVEARGAFVDVYDAFVDVYETSVELDCVEIGRLNRSITCDAAIPRLL